MLARIARLFRPLPPDPAPAAPSVDWAPIIWAYVQSLWPGGWSLKNSNRAEKECGWTGRGLAYGKVRITKGDQGRVELTTLGEPLPGGSTLKDALRQALDEQGLKERVKLVVDDKFHSIEAVFTDENDPLPGHHVSGTREPFHWKMFLGSGMSGMEAPSVEALRALLRACELQGFPAGPKHYANESPTPIEDIIVYAVRWEDPDTHARYLDVLWRPELVVAGYTQGGGKSDDRMEGACKGEVLASHTDGAWWPKKVINNRPVYAAVAKEPTRAMLAAREKFRAQEADWKRCGVEGCGKSAAWDVYVARFVMEDDFGESSHGGIYRSCDDPAHLETQKTSHGGVKTTVSPTHHEKW